MCLSRQEWVDGIGQAWMTISQLGRCSQLGLGFYCWARWAWCSIAKHVYYCRYSLFLPFKTARMGGGWCCYLILDNHPHPSPFLRNRPSVGTLYIYIYLKEGLALLELVTRYMM